ncbi:fructose-bisphosphatase class I [Siphonobacter sp. BAB-5385]|uniref:class 1 fructose-bisphosphatase n=1 Tax=unclassified Siphonobacter TaxID=2635712 RepID=UPI000B9E4863|nr:MULTISPECIES: class 1 fructose-bisphosphatase [unclassified Siphonobacter]OZI08402.1 fructose-bisphosphatase class I [Siphonobacter sp. BAB-5385]PMD97142.1 fructose-bisphosphatase class I [Siphonobacter sp. BAB-5405]
MTFLDETIALPVGVTLDRFIKRNQEAFPFATGELSQLLRDIALAAKIVNREINKAGLVDVTGALGTSNIQGEAQQKLDMIAHIRFMRALRNGGEVAGIVSEEEENIVFTGNDEAKYVVAIDPLDGSSNIDVNVSIGTIFSIYRRLSPQGTKVNTNDFLQGGEAQVAAGYVLYGSSTVLVYTTGHGVNGFTYESSLGEFFLSYPTIQIPEDGNLYSINDGNMPDFPEAILRYIDVCRSRRYSARYIGSLVGDFHRNLLKGGIYFYPPTRKTPQGKLRLLYECYPLAFIVEQAGGMATDGKQRLLEVEIRNLHQRSSLCIGSSNMVKEANQVYVEQGTMAE